jgi:hypothetical protein
VFSISSKPEQCHTRRRSTTVRSITDRILQITHENAHTAAQKADSSTISESNCDEALLLGQKVGVEARRAPSISMKSGVLVLVRNVDFVRQVADVWLHVMNAAQ